MLLMSWIFERKLTLRWEALEGYYEITTMEYFSRSPFASKHLPPSDHRTSQEARCLSAEMLDIACPCEGPSNFVAQLTPKPGIFLVIVLAKNVCEWRDPIRPWPVNWRALVFLPNVDECQFNAQVTDLHVISVSCRRLSIE